MRKIAITVCALALLAGSLTAGGRHYFYTGGRYYRPYGFSHHPYYRGGFRTFGYSPSFSFGIYRPSRYLSGAACDYPRPYAGYYGPSYAVPRSYPVVLSLPVSSEVVRANFSDMIFNVTPSKALVYVDDKLIGSARSFATERDRFTVLQGEHELRIEHPGFEPFLATLDVVHNRTLRIDVELNRLDSPEDSRR